MSACILLECYVHGFSLLQPYYDPAEVVRLAKKDGRQEYIETAKKYCLKMKERFGNFYDEMEISIDEIITDL